MQTFVTSTDHAKTAAGLDSKRLNKQLLEGRQILDLLTSPDYATRAWRNHPAVLMWKGYEAGLYDYLDAVVTECDERGIKTDKNWTAIHRIVLRTRLYNEPIVQPWWLTDPVLSDRLITSHRANLYRKDPDFYADFRVDFQYNEPCCQKCNYFWPTHLEKR